MIRTATGIAAILVMAIGSISSAGAAMTAPSDTPEMTAGQHCLNRLHHSNPFFVDAVKATLPDPRSFVEVATTIGPLGSKGRHLGKLQYRTSAGAAVAYAAIDHVTCKAVLLHSPAEMRRLVG